MLNLRLETDLHPFHLGLQLQVETGQTTVLLGESGAGKSTVLRLLAGLLRPRSGLIELDGQVYFDSSQGISRAPQERPFGYVFQDYVLFPHLTVFENVAFGLKAQRLPGKLVRQRVGEALELVHLVGYDRRRPGQLSGGQQQRVALARALVLQPRLLLLDEPLSALDVQTRREVRQELRRILQQARITTLLVTHHYIEALLFGEQIVVMDGGKIVQRGTQRDLAQRPRSPYVAELVGMNLFQGQVSACEDRLLCTVHVGHPALEIQAVPGEMRESQAATALPLIVGQDARVVVDPRSIMLSVEQPTGSARNVLRGEIVQLLPLGVGEDEGTRASGSVRVSLHIAVSATPLVAEITAASAEQMKLREGDLVYASFKALEARAYT
jgi:molybdate transport system ATP-binding protein